MSSPLSPSSSSSKSLKVSSCDLVDDHSGTDCSNTKRRESFRLMGNKAGTFEDIVDAYLAYLQVAVVNPATEKALLRLQCEDPTLCSEWAMIQLMDFVQALLNTECASLEIFEDPSAMPLVEAYPRANAAELLELNQILVAENHSGSLLQAFDAWLQNIEQFHTGKHA
ncbi:hypothetical protein YC2023_035878 [Brassica napus]